MADIGLGRADRHGRARAPHPHRLADRAGFDRVACRGAGAMRLEIGDAIGIHHAIGQQRTQQCRLRLLVGQRQPDSPPRRIDARGQDDPLHRIAIGHRVVEPLEHHHCAALGPHITVSPRVEGMAAAGRTEHSRPGKAAERKGAEQHVDAADHRGRDPSQPQRLAGMMQRHEPRRAGGIDRLCRTTQVEDVGDPVGDDGQRPAGHHVSVGTRRIELPQIGPVGRAGAHVDAQFAPGDGGFGPAGMFQRLAHQLQHQPLLRVHLRRLARREAEHRMVEIQHVTQYAGGEGIGLARLLPARVQPGGMIEPVGRHLGHGIPPGREQRPEACKIDRAGQPAGGADNGDGRADRERAAHRAALPPVSGAAPARGRGRRGRGMCQVMACQGGGRQPARIRHLAT